MLIIGLMSGTSYDGVDVAVADFRRTGDTLRLDPLGHRGLPYPEWVRLAIEAILPPRPTTIEAVCQLDNQLGRIFAEAAAVGLELAGGRADLVVAPGQTVYHWVTDGHALGTLQLGAPAWIAQLTGLPVLSDLRGADIAAGGQGAPLVPAFDALLLGPGDGPARAALNLGGIANLTVVAPGKPVLGYDIGPANALLDAAARRYFGARCDLDGRLAAAGRVHPALLESLLAEPYYAAAPPKSTGRELFHDGYLDGHLANVTGPVAPADVLATLTELTARTVAQACDRHRVAEVIAAGGGIRNPVLRDRLGRLGAGRWRLRAIDELGVPAQAKEAYAFALLGWLSWHQLPGALPSVTGAASGRVLGRITPGSAALTLPPPAVTAPGRLVIGRPDPAPAVIGQPDIGRPDPAPAVIGQPDPAHHQDQQR